MTWIVLILWALGYWVLFRVPGCRGRAGARSLSGVAVIIPARDEAESLPRLLASLNAAAGRPAEVIVVDDESADDTVAVAARLGARVIRSAPLPDGWRGKTWACHQGAAAARGDAFLFLDADTWFEPGGPARLYDCWAGEGEALSVGPYHEVRSPYEQLSAFFNLVMHAGVGAFTPRGPRRPPEGLFGQCLLISRTDYERCGGHAAVRGTVLENFFLAARMTQAGIRLRCLGGRGTLSMRMYPQGARELVEGWSKAFARGAGRTSRKIMIPLCAWMSGGCMAAGLALRAAWVPNPAAPLLYLLFALQILAMLRQIGSFRWYAALFYPLLLAFFFVVFARSSRAQRRGAAVTWKGRSFAEEERG